ncbi:hypothetical protein [Streptomyces sp. NPDC058045]|uniref:hypothetical protein n=1 Tax=Streptomyces sp. NPDC058045 TaxID=3346311 RepID=UPI0036E2EDD9
MGSSHGAGLGQGGNGEDADQIALAEMDLCGELMIAAASAGGERLSADLIDEVLRVAGRPQHAPGDRGRTGSGPQ